MKFRHRKKRISRVVALNLFPQDQTFSSRKRRSWFRGREADGTEAEGQDRLHTYLSAGSVEIPNARRRVFSSAHRGPRFAIVLTILLILIFFLNT